MSLLSVWFLIVGFLAVFAAFILPATASLAASNRDKLAELMAAHERNLQSDDPAVVASSKERWAKMCQFMKDTRCSRRHGEALEAFGRAAEQMFAK